VGVPRDDDIDIGKGCDPAGDVFGADCRVWRPRHPRRAVEVTKTGMRQDHDDIGAGGLEEPASRAVAVTASSKLRAGPSSVVAFHWATCGGTVPGHADPKGMAGAVDIFDLALRMTWLGRKGSPLPGCCALASTTGNVQQEGHGQHADPEIEIVIAQRRGVVIQRVHGGDHRMRIVEPRHAPRGEIAQRMPP
jgi:hypothetical protein